MRFENGTPPDWITQLLEVISGCFKPEIACGPLGYVWIPPQNRKRPWKVSVFPTPGEVIEAGPQDGKVVIPGFQMNLAPVMKCFERVHQIDWLAPSEYTGELDGPGIVIHGRAYDVDLQLFLFEEPPDAFRPTVYFDQIEGKTRLRPSDTDE